MRRAPPRLKARVDEPDTITGLVAPRGRDKLAERLTDQEVSALRHLVNECTGLDILSPLSSDPVSRPSLW